MSTPPDDSIASRVRAAQGGDVRAFEALVRAFQDLAVAYATSLLGDYHLAEDVAQESFLDAYRLLGSLRDPGAFSAWFRRIVFKHCDRITRKQRHLTGLEAALGVASREPGPDSLVEAAEIRATLSAAIATLSPPEQEVVLLYYLGDQSQAAIADFLGVTPNTVKTRLHSARQRLRVHMTDIERDLGAARPSEDSRFAEHVRRLIQPEALKQQKPWMWSPGIGAQVWEMFCACILGDLETVKRLLDADPSLVRSHYEYRTPLSFAVRENHLEVAEYLLDHGALEAKLGDPLEMAKDRGYDAMVALLERKQLELWGASREGDEIAQAIRDYDLPRVRALLDARPELLRAGDRTGSLAIHWAVMTRNLPMIDELLARGADLNVPRGDHALPIHLTNGDYDYRGWRDVPAFVTTTPDEVFRHLRARGAHIDLGMACFTGDVARVRELLAEDPTSANRLPPYNAYYVGAGAPLKNAASGGHLEIVKFLLAAGADPNLPEEGIAPQGHALYSAVYNGHYDIAKLLLESGAYPNPAVESSAEATWIAIRRRDKKMLALLGSYGAVMHIPIDLPLGMRYKNLLDSRVGLPLKIRCFYGDTKGVQAMLADDPALADDSGALEAAAGKGHEKIVRLLLEHAPDVAKRVRVYRPGRVAELLFAHGMDASCPNWMRITQLHHKAGEGDIEQAAFLIDHGADLEARDEEWRSTPLAWAARSGHTRMVEFLLRKGARPNLPDDPPWATALAWARKRGHEDVIRVLEKFEAAGAPKPPRLVELEALANDLVSAFDTGDDAALQRIIRHFRVERPLMWDRPTKEVLQARFREGVARRIAETRGGQSGLTEAQPVAPGTRTLTDARMLIALAEGYADWEQLARAAS